MGRAPRGRPRPLNGFLGRLPQEKRGPLGHTIGMRILWIAVFALGAAVSSGAAEFDASTLKVSNEVKELSRQFSKKMKANAAMRASAEAPRYSTRCELKDGKGYGFVTNHGRERLSLRGRIYWYFYDADGREIDDDRDRISERISRGDTEMVDEEDAPSDAKSCAIDVSEAVEDGEGGDDDGDYSASCELRDARGVGFITVRNASSIRFSGRVTYYFFDARGRETDKERDRISIRVRRNDREEVGSVSAPADAASCSLDVSEAAPS